MTVLTETDINAIGKRLKNVTVMPNPLALSPLKEATSKERIILAAGRVDNWHYKGFDILLKAWGRIVRNEENRGINKDWWLKIAGVWRGENTIDYLTGLLPDGEWREDEGRWKSKRYYVEFLGFVNDMKSLYQQSSVFVLSSRYEAFGLVLIEAMSQGCAPVACDYKGRQKEIICPDRANNSSKFNLNLETTPLCGVEVYENGICCEPDNVEALTEALRKMMIDDKYRHQAQVNAVERSKFYDMEHTMDRWETYLNDVVKK